MAQVAVVVFAMAVVVGSGLWWWISTTGLETKDRSAIQLQAVQIALSIGVAGGGLFALYLAFRRQNHAEITARAMEHDATERRVTDLYTKAVDQLGAEQAPVRLGGLYALERLAQDNPNQRQAIVNVLCSYLRMPYTPPGPRPLDSAPEAERERFSARTQEREVRYAAQRILRYHLRPGTDEDPVVEFWKDIDLDLTYAPLVGFDLSRCVVRRARFRGAQFFGRARFDDVRFSGDAGFSGARFAREATFSRARFGADVRFQNAKFRGRACFDDVQFLGTVNYDDPGFFGGASFVGVAFAGSVPRGVVALLLPTGLIEPMPEPTEGAELPVADHDL